MLLGNHYTKLVRDAAITQEGHKFSLAIVVNYAVSEEYARELGDNFVRLTKTLGPDDRPSKEIGQGKYDYLVGVYRSNEQEVVLGAKDRNARRITW